LNRRTWPSRDAMMRSEPQTKAREVRAGGGERSMKLPTYSDLVRLVETMDRHPLGAMLLVALGLVAVAGVWAWRH